MDIFCHKIKCSIDGLQIIICPITFLVATELDHRQWMQFSNLGSNINVCGVVCCSDSTLNRGSGPFSTCMQKVAVGHLTKQ